MDVGILLIFQNFQGQGTDEEMVRDQMALADLVEPLGYDVLRPPEHHFTDYSACPDNIQYEHFQIDMNTSRDRFDEAASRIIEGLENGFVEGAGLYYPHVRTEIRPRPPNPSR